MIGEWPTCITEEYGAGRMSHRTYYHGHCIYLEINIYHPDEELSSWELVYDGFVRASMRIHGYTEHRSSRLPAHYQEFARIMWNGSPAVRPDSMFDIASEAIKYFFPTVWMERLL